MRISSAQTERSPLTWTVAVLLVLGSSGAAAACPAGASSGGSTRKLTSALQVALQPANRGQALLDAIDSACTSIDIAIYQIGDPAVVQALAAKMAQGVSVRVVMDGSSSTTASPNGAFVNGMVAAMTCADKAAGPMAIQRCGFDPRWASNNFEITHQKAVIIDAVDRNGQPQNPLPPSARMLISTGNFLSTSKYTFHAATDFYLTTTAPALIAQASAVFNSDFRCDAPTVNNAAAGALNPAGPLIWSNGSWANAATQGVGWPMNQYPEKALSYPAPMPAPIGYTAQGNVAAYQSALIRSAQPNDLLRIYNEEFSSGKGTNPVYALLLAAARKKVDVRVMMSFNPSYASDQATFARAGGTVTLLAPQAYLGNITDYAGPTYIHAKAFLLSGPDGSFKQGWVGSTNLGTSSIFANREMGLALQPSDATVAQKIIDQFDSDTAWADNPAGSLLYAIRWTAANVGAKGSPSEPPEWLGSAKTGAFKKSSVASYSTQHLKACGSALPSRRPTVKG